MRYTYTPFEAVAYVKVHIIDVINASKTTNSQQ